MNPWDPADHRHQLWRELRDLTFRLQKLADDWLRHDPEVQTLQDVLKLEHQEPPEPELQEDLPW